MESVQRNIRKCFESVAKIIFQDESRYIEGLLSLEGEAFKLSKVNVNVKGEIEGWLKMLEGAIE